MAGLIFSSVFRRYSLVGCPLSFADARFAGDEYGKLSESFVPGEIFFGCRFCVTGYFGDACVDCQFSGSRCAGISGADIDFA